MKRILWALIGVLALSLVTTPLAFANGGPHGGYTATTDGCAGCHRTHTASGPKLVVDTNTYSLCMSCHGSAGTGANTNVDDGLYLASRDDSGGNYDHGAANTPDNANLLGGGFVNYGGAAVTSSHDPTGTTDQAWGYGNAARGTAAAIADGALTCASCHDPHGSANYRIINETINGTAVTVAAVDEGTAKDYDTEQWGAGMSGVCAACHGNYHRNNPDQASINDGGSYTHRVDMPYQYRNNDNPETVGLGGYTLPLAQSGAGDMVVCTTCHFSHGTSAAMSGLGQDPYTNDSALLRLDNRGVCEVCHQK
jgi:predicted CXXCH cytochrome family protein